MTSGFDSKFDRVMTQEQFVEVVDAILNGKYSWACVLILRFAGYNPLHYIPYRTYNRLMKENCKRNRKNQHPPVRSTVLERSRDIPSDRALPKGESSNISDLEYLELAGKHQSRVQGGSLAQWLTETLKHNLSRCNLN